MAQQGMKQVYVTRLTDVDTKDKEGVGTIRQEGSSWYKYCLIQNATGTVAGAAGSLVSYFAGTGYANSRVVIKVADADTIPVGAGTLCGTCPGVSGTAYYGWVQVEGPVTVDTAITSAAAGKMFIMTTTDKTGAVSANAYDARMGVCLNGTTSALLSCPL